MAYSRKDIEQQHSQYKGMMPRWEYFIRSYLGGKEYQDGKFLQEYQLELESEYFKRLNYTPLDNHARNVIDIYSSFLFRVPPTRELGTLQDDPSVDQFLDDADYEGRTFDALMREVQNYASIYGHCWLLVDKPPTNVFTRAEELQQGIRPYLNIYTPENIYDWHYTRSESGYYVLDYLKIRESIDEQGEYFKLWYLDKIDTVYISAKNRDEPKLIESLPNPLGRIPAVIVYNQRSPMRGIGVSDLTDIADLQKAIYNELSEIEQIIRLSNHPSLVKTRDTDATAGAGSIIEIPDNIDANLKPYILQPSGSNLDGVLKSIEHKVDAINRLSHVGAIRATGERIQSGIALRTEFQLLNAKLAEKAKLMELAEEQMWQFWFMYYDQTWMGKVEYPGSFNIRDTGKEIEQLAIAKNTATTASLGETHIRTIISHHTNTYRIAIFRRKKYPLARLQTFPDNFEFVRNNGSLSAKKYPLSTSDGYRVLGNAVPPLLAFHIAMRIKKNWDLYFKAN